MFMKLKDIINGLSKQDLKEYKVKQFICGLEDNTRIVYQDVNGGSSDGNNIYLLIAYNKNGVKSSIVLDPYNTLKRSKSDYEILLWFLRTYQGEKVEDFNLTMSFDKPKTEVWVYKQKNSYNALTYNTKIENILVVK